MGVISMNMDDLAIKPVVASASLRTLAYEALKTAITNMDIYGQKGEVRLDERGLSQSLGVSRTPIREALTVLEQEGFVRNEPRRGVFVVKKTKKEIVEMIHAWAALESMAARLACTEASDKDLSCMRRMFPEFFEGEPADHLAEYSEANLRFHQKIISLGQSSVIKGMCSNLLIHVKGIRNAALRQGDRAQTSIDEHRQIIQALESRDADQAERLVRDHGLGLADHVQRYGTHLE